MAHLKRRLTGAADAGKRTLPVAHGDRTLPRCFVVARRPLQLRDDKCAGRRRPEVVKLLEGMSAFHLAADGIPGLEVFESIPAHWKPLALDFYLHVPRTLVSAVTDLALQTTCGPRKAVGKAVRAGNKAFDP